MQRDDVFRVARKELTLFFASPIGYLFLASYLAVTLFVFFWGEAFFARNIADVRPVFEWLPILLIFLSAALTMRMWSEERRTGTLELVATVPVSTWSFVLGKFLACWALLALALVLTAPLPITVALIADLDWGPVWAGYLAAMLLGGAYLAIGLFVSARTENQIVSLIFAVLLGGAFYLIGSPVITELTGNQVGQVLRSLATGARFESITRGVVDLRDLYFYISLIAVFLALNVYALEQQRWSKGSETSRHRRWRLGTGLLAANLLLANVWLAELDNLRVDVTEGNIYSISNATENYLARLDEPLLIRGYFSSKTHPLLAPLVPQMKDLLNEYEVAGDGRVRVEIVDPAEEPELEEEANTKYGIQPVPFQVQNRYRSALVSSYFDVLVKYGSEYEVLGFRDLIEVKVASESELDVALRNPEYDVTRAIRKVLYGFQSGGEVFDSIQSPVAFTAYISSDDALPESLVEFKDVVEETLTEYAKAAGDKLTVEIVDPTAGDGSVAERIAETYGFQPMAASLFDTNTFYFYLTLAGDNDTVVQIPLPADLTEESLRRSMDAAFERFAEGFLKTIALVTPETPPPFMAQRGMGGNSYRQLTESLRTDMKVEVTRLEDGRVPPGTELLAVVDPTSLTEVQVFAIDQFLMRGGTVIVSAGAYASNLTQQSLTVSPRSTGLEQWLDRLGVSIEDALVMDPQNAAFPVPVTRRVGGFSFQEIRMLDYPYFVDVRTDGLNQDSPITAGLPQVTIPWVSPIVVDDSAEGRTVTTLIESSAGSWTSTETDVMPKIGPEGLSAFVPQGEQKRRVLGVSIEGRFDSFFAGEPSPLLAAAEADDEADAASADEAAADAADAADDADDADDAGDGEDSEEEESGVIGSVLERSPESARLIVFGSNEFLSDQTLRMIGSAAGTIYGNSVQLMANAIDVALEEEGLLSIRSRGHFNRTLPPLSAEEQASWETLNYVLAVLALIVVFLVNRSLSKRAAARYRAWLAA